MNIVDAKDNLTMMKPMVEMISKGTVRMITLPAIKVDDLIKELKSPYPTWSKINSLPFLIFFI